MNGEHPAARCDYLQEIFKEQFSIGELLGKGPLAEVYKAVRKKDNLTVAVKFPPPQGTSNLQFLQEAENWKRLDHPHIVRLLEYGARPIPFLVMEYMPGGSLRERIGSLDFRQSLTIALQVAEALFYAHRRGLWHFDIKPENILFDDEGDAKLSDWGLSRLALAVPSAAAPTVGTAHYLAPEQLLPGRHYEDWGIPTDIWQYGVTLYEMVTGQLPFPAQELPDLRRQILRDQPVRPTRVRPDIPPELESLVLSCLAKDQEARYEDFFPIREQLKSLLGVPRPVTAFEAKPTPPVIPTALSVKRSELPTYRWTTFTTKDGLAGNDVRAITQDSKGDLWFGTFGRGVSRYDGTHWTIFTTRDGLTDNHVRAIAEDNQGHFWFGTRDGGVSRYDGTRWTTFTAKDGLADNAVRAIAQDSKGNLWFGADGGVSRYDGSRWTTFTKKDGLPNDAVLAIARDNEGNLWFGTWGGGVTCYDGARWKTFREKDGLVDNWVRAIARDDQSNLWFGTARVDVLPPLRLAFGGGLSRYFGGRWTTFTTKDGLAHNDVRAIAQDNERNLWFGTLGGVSRYDGARWTTFTTRDGLADNYVWAIALDRQGHLWFGTEGGVSVLRQE